MSTQTRWNDTIEIHHPKTLGAAPLPAQRIPIGVPGDCKPCIAQLTGGELLLVAFHTTQTGDTKPLWGQSVGLRREDALLFRSTDGGQTWSEPDVFAFVGREPYFTVLSDGIVLMTAQMLPQDVRNERDHGRAFVHRSTDRGKTWQSREFAAEDLPGWEPGAFIFYSRTVLETEDGGLMMGVGCASGYDYQFRSDDRGATWHLSETCMYEHFGSGQVRDMGYPVCAEAVYRKAANGDLIGLMRLSPLHLPPLGGVALPDGHWDHHERLALYRSKDGGKYWSFSEVGSTYAEMYPAILKLHDGRLLLTFTVRDLHPPLGVRAVLGEETPDGFTFDFEHDRLMLDTKTPAGMDSGGGFGCTVQLEDDTLVTSYSYRAQNDQMYSEVVRWKLPDGD
ncbi:MAG: sialidase family protein [Candidatus Latescibacterota bacterium]